MRSRPVPVLVQAPAIRKDDLPQEPPVPVAAGAPHGDRAVERELRGEPPGAIAVGLALLRCVHTQEAHRLRVTSVEHRDRVAIGDPDDAARELVRRGGSHDDRPDGEPWQHSAEELSRYSPPRLHGSSVCVRIRGVTIRRRMGSARTGSPGAQTG
jgi:hypothetical protein